MNKSISRNCRNCNDICLQYLLDLKANLKEIDNLSKRRHKKIFDYTYNVEGGDWDKGLSKEDHAEQLRWYLESQEFEDAMPYYKEYDKTGIPSNV